VHRSYLKPIRALAAGLLRGAAHITGGGLTDNTPRMLPEGLAAEIDTGAWTIPPIFELLRRLGNLPEDDYRRTFNLGIGMILAVPRAGKRGAPKTLLRSWASHSSWRPWCRKSARAAGGVPVKRLGILLSGARLQFRSHRG
jgi:phosphoribosylaminoimidazole (AIR) synthetase